MEKELKFVRLRNGEDIIGYCTDNEKNNILNIENPLLVEVDTIYEEGKQLIAMREYLPQAILDTKDIDIEQEEIMFIASVREEFVEEYQHVSEYFYSAESRVKTKKKKARDASDGNVVSLIDALLDKKDKPLH